MDSSTDPPVSRLFNKEEVLLSLDSSSGTLRRSPSIRSFNMDPLFSNYYEDDRRSQYSNQGSISREQSSNAFYTGDTLSPSPSSPTIQNIKLDTVMQNALEIADNHFGKSPKVLRKVSVVSNDAETREPKKLKNPFRKKAEDNKTLIFSFQEQQQDDSESRGSYNSVPRDSPMWFKSPESFDELTSSIGYSCSKLSSVNATSDLMKRERFWDYLTSVASKVYAIGVFFIGVFVYGLDVFVNRKTLRYSAEYFNLYLVIIGSIWLIWLLVDINKYLNHFKKLPEEEYKKLDGEFKFEKGPDGDMLLCIPMSAVPEKLPQYYCFSKGRHSGSLYLKIGVAIFFIGHLIQIGLNLGKQITYFVYDDYSNGPECRSFPKLLFCVIHPIFLFLQLYITLKYSNVIVNRSRGLARMAFMHCITTSMCIWFYNITAECVDSLVNKKYFLSKSCKSDFREFNNSSESLCMYEDNCQWIEENELHFESNISCIQSIICHCASHNEFAKYIFELGPFLYPASIEFSTLTVGIWYIMWDSIGKIKENEGILNFLPNYLDNNTLDTDEKDSLTITADLHSSNKGIFFGIIYLVIMTIGLILYFIFSNSTSCDLRKLGMEVNNGIEFFLIFVMTVITVWAYYQICKLDINPHPISFLDDLLLFISLPSFFLLSLLHFMPGIMSVHDSIGSLLVNGIILCQVFIQTPMIVDGLRRCSNSKENLKQRPGRNSVTFLIIANLAIFTWQTSEIKSGNSADYLYKFYGETLWTFLSHIIKPLSIFYRFHSSVALADIWNCAYQPAK